MRYLDAEALRRALPMAEAISAMELAFGDDREVPQRLLLRHSLFMPGRVGAYTGVKVVSTTPGSPEGIVAVFDEEGRPMGLVDGPTLTAIRTGAGAGLATRLLARPESSVMAMLGAGAMAPDQISAVAAARPIERVLVWSRTPAHAGRLAARVGGEVVTESAQAVGMADVVTTATPATSPLFSPDSVRPGTHLNAIGAFTPEMIEIPPEVTNDAFVVVDDLTAAAAEAGDLLQADRRPDGTLGDLLAGRLEVPDRPFTFFKSVGIASQDVAAAVRALERAADLDIGISL